MSKSKRMRALKLDRIEIAYLNALRIGVLGVATICLVIATYFAVDAAWRIFVSTKVPVEPTTVSAAEVVVALKKPEVTQSLRGDNTIPDGVKLAHAKFVNGAFTTYYAVYKKAADAYKKPDDKLLNRDDLLEYLGYDLGTYAGGTDLSVKMFVESADYQSQALSAINGTMSDAAVVSQLKEYKSAQKTARQCSTVYEPRSVWDYNSTACYNWYLEPRGCSVNRNVPVERCVPAYPAGIVSPLTAFKRADAFFAETWIDRSSRNAARARSEEADRQALRDGMAPRLLMALKVIAGFLVIMFFFLLVAIERHLRDVAKRQAVRPGADVGS